MDSANLNHLGIIMDGNGRWATKRHLPRTAGHLEGSKALKRIALACKDRGIKYLSLYAFSTENWKRPAKEVNYLMGLLATKLFDELTFFNKNGMRVLVRGDWQHLPEKPKAAVIKTMEATKENTNLTVILAINYGGHLEICTAINKIIQSGYKGEVTPQLLRSNMQYPDIPAVDMICRSAGEKRLSNFLLWESAYAELGFYGKLFPEWNESDIDQIIDDYSLRTRKFGGLAK